MPNKGYGTLSTEAQMINKHRGDDWTSGFFLVWPMGDVKEEETHILVFEVRDWRERESQEFAGDPLDILLDMRTFTGKGRIRLLSHDPRSLHQDLVYGSPPEWEWLWGQELLTFYSICEPAQISESIKRTGSMDDKREQAHAYLRLLRSCRDKVMSLEDGLREQVAALLWACRSPWAYLFSPSPAKVRPRAFAEAAMPCATPRGSEDATADIRSADSCRPGLTHDSVRDVLGRISPGSGHPDDLEERPQQLRMAEEVAEALSDGAYLAVEAGTGVGKSLAYLIPASLLALSERSRVLISTHTKALQDQLCSRDLPRLAKALPGLRFSLLKGRSNYLCLRRWEEWVLYAFEETYGGKRLLLDRERDMLLAWALMLIFLGSTRSGDLEELPLEAAERLREHMEEFRSLAESCPGPTCPHRDRCFLEAARRRASESHLVVVNHALLLAGSSPGDSEDGERAVLPSFEHLVVDEAHHLEAVATEAFSRRLSLNDCRAIAERLEGRRGLLRRIEAFLSEAEEECAGTVGFPGIVEVREELAALQPLWHRFFIESLPDLPRSPPRGKRSGEGRGTAVPEAERGNPLGAGEIREAASRVVGETEGSPAWERLSEEGEILAGRFDSLAAALEGLKAGTARAGASSSRAEAEGKALEAWASRISLLCTRHADTLRSFFRGKEGDREGKLIRWWEISASKSRGEDIPAYAAICAAPAEVGSLLVDRLFMPLRSSVLTSATLRAGGGKEGFSYFAASTGLELLSQRGREVRFSVLGSPFDYARQARCLLVRGLSEPGGSSSSDQAYLKEMAGVLEEALLASKGRGLILFTSYDMLERAYTLLSPRLRAHGIPCLKQERGSGNLRLLERFREEIHSVLFATASFWEGVDVPGESLSLVAIARLPFPYPGDPLVEGRQEFLERESGKSGWLDFYLPCAVMRFRQGLGRLIRRRDDRGVMLVLDPRLCGRSYARPFLESLPDGLRPQQVEAGRVGEIVREFLSMD